MLRIAERYPLPVWGARPWSARNDAKQQSKCSDTGKGELTLNFRQKAWKRLRAAAFVFCIDGARPF